MLSIESTAPRLDNRILVAVTGALGTIAAFFNILDYFLDFLFYLSIIFVPVAGVIAVDYLLLRRSAYHEQRLELEETWRLPALISWAAGASLALAATWEWFALSGIAAVDAVIVAALTYWLLSRLAHPPAATPQLRGASS